MADSGEMNSSLTDSDLERILQDIDKERFEHLFGLRGVVDPEVRFRA